LDIFFPEQSGNPLTRNWTRQPEVYCLLYPKHTTVTTPTKISAIHDWPVPKKKQELQCFLGFCNFYHRFIKDYLKIAKLLTILTGDIHFEWTSIQQTAFQTLINAITTQPVLALPHPTGQFCLEANSSNYAISAILSQLQDNKWHPIAYLSKSLTETQ
jgi:hypothetical protein